MFRVTIYIKKIYGAGAEQVTSCQIKPRRNLTLSVLVSNMLSIDLICSVALLRPDRAG